MAAESSTMSARGRCTGRIVLEVPSEKEVRNGARHGPTSLAMDEHDEPTTSPPAQPVGFPTLPPASGPAATAEGLLTGVGRGVEAASAVATTVTTLGNGSAAPEAVIGSTLSSLGGGLAGAASFTSGLDPAVSQALGVASTAATAAAAGFQSVRGILDAVRTLAERANRHQVRYAFRSDADPDADWTVTSFEMTERLGEPYRATLVLSCADLDVDARALLGRDAWLSLERAEGHARHVAGVVERVELGRATDRARVVTVTLVPALALLALTQDSRIFQGRDATEILTDVLENALDGYGREIELRTHRVYRPREYCVQYQESDLAFATRLMEEEGITFFFEGPEGTRGKEKMILVDDRAGLTRLSDDDAPVPFVAQRSETSDTEHVHELRSADRMRATSFSLTDLDWTQPIDRAVIRHAIADSDAQGRARERYEHGRAITLYDYAAPHYGFDDGKTRVTQRREAHLAEARTFEGKGNLIALGAGRTFAVEGHPVRALDGELLAVSVTHRGHAPDRHDVLGQEAFADDDTSYECRFEAIPEAVPFRMAERTPKPRIPGLLSAIVVGADGQEIHTDVHRRVRVQMRWDREGTFDARSSCFVRVLQPWAGAGFGALFLPRVGMEVAIAFLDGDPDRPVVSGCLYDRDNPPPYTSDEDATKSTLKTKSSPDPGDGDVHYNELRFEDAAGHEQVFLRAERDLDELVLHDHTTHVRNNQTQRVDGDQRETIGGSQTLHVRQDRSAQIDGEEDVIVEQRQGTQHRSDHRHIVGGELHQTVRGPTKLEHLETREINVRGLEKESYRGGREIWTNQHERQSVQGDAQLFVHGTRRVEVDAGHVLRCGETTLVLNGTRIDGSATDAITLSVGGSTIAIASNGHITVSAASQLALGCGAAGIVLSPTGEVSITGSQRITLSTGPASIELTPTGVTTHAPQIDATADVAHNIAGSIVRIN
jgi:type VI secretion system secreted protein VgrG